MDVLTTAAVFAPPRGRALRVGLGLSAVLHGMMAVLLLTMPVRAVIADAPIEVAVDLVADVPMPAAPSAPPVLALSSPPAEGSLAPRVREARRPARPRAPERAPAPSPPAQAASEQTAPAEEPPAPGAPVDESASPVAVEAGQPAQRVASPASTGSASGGGSRGATDGAPGALGGTAQHRAMVDRYRTDVVGSRIRQVFRYPGEARELELAGRVLLKVSIGRDGRLLEVRLAGRCPHAILCADGLRTIRAAAPFPPIPTEFGASITVEVPLTYAFEVD